MSSNDISHLLADECATLLADEDILSNDIGPKPGFNFRQMLRDGREGLIDSVEGAFQEAPNSRWVIRNLDMDYCVITENDISKWRDKTGELYHFPKRYLKFLQPGTKVIYYKGKLGDKSYSNGRLSDNPHYFGYATIGNYSQDATSSKNDYFCQIKDFTPFRCYSISWNN